MMDKKQIDIKVSKLLLELLEELKKLEKKKAK